ncbi:MAG: SCO family protein [Granulosicoccaceae bacterium]
MTIPSDTPTLRNRWPIIAVIAAVAVIAGIIANKAVYRKNSDATATAQPTDAEKKQLRTLQESLATTAVFPKNFITVPAFSLIDQQGEAVTESLFKNQWSMVFFGYTHCPDICPMTMTIMNSVADELKASNTQALQVVFVSVDPKRDTADVLGNYMNFFNPTFKGITGKLADVLALTGKLGIVASYTTIEGTEDYLVDHTASMLLIDPEGRVRGKFSAPHKVESIVDDYKKILDNLG